MIYTNTIPNNKIIPNLNEPKTFAPANYWRMLNKNAEKYTKILAPGKTWRMVKTWRLVKTWRMAKTWRMVKTWCMVKTWRMVKTW
jgi:hypothetical protein